MKQKSIILFFLFFTCSFFFFQKNSFGQEGLTLRLESEKSALLEGESGTFTLILNNESATDVLNISVAFTLNKDFQILVETATTTNGDFEGGWFIDTLRVGTSDTLSFEATSSGYAQFIAEVTTDNDLLIGRCFSSDCYPDDNFRCFYTNCTTQADEVLYPVEYFELEFAAINCLPTGTIGCGARYNITFENTSNVASAPINLFLRADIGETGVFYQQSGNTLVVPSIPVNSTFDFVADFGACIEDRPFASVNGLQLGLTQSNVISLFTTGTQTAPLSAFDALTDIDYCTEVNTTDIAIRAGSDGIIYPDNTGTFQVFVTNNGDETAESIQITYGRNIRGNNGDVISYSATSEYVESSLSEDDESRNRFLDYDKYWTIRNLAPNETAVLNVTANVEEFVGIFTTTVSVNDNSFLNDTNTDNNRTNITFERRNFTDLELSMKAPVFPFPRYTPNIVILTLRNNGSETATGIEVTLDLSDRTQAVLVGEFEAIISNGIFKPVPKLWQIDTLLPMAEATLEVQYFPLVENYVPYAQVTAADQEDVDSTPNNGTCCTPNEDDEAALILPPYTLVGNAVPLDSNLYRLTDAVNSQAGAVWSENLIDLTQDFLMDAALYLGTDDGGADGIAFVFQPLCENIGDISRGEFIGYGGISPSLIIEFDTYQNGFDPISDHVAILKNGNGNHSTAETISEPIPVDNLENGVFHPASIAWDADLQQLTVMLDGQTIYSDIIGDIINDIFLGNELVFWGFTAATGGLNNEHRVRILEFVAEEVATNCDNLQFIENRTEEVLTPATLQLFPNPTSAMLQVSGFEASTSTYAIFDLLGRVVQTGQLNDGIIDASPLAKGTYFLQVEGQAIRFLKL